MNKNFLKGIGWSCILVPQFQFSAFGGGRSWYLPGGKLEKGETLEEGIIREMREETGALVEVERMLCIADADFKDLAALHILFRLKWCGGKIGVQGECHESVPITNVKFVPISSLTEYGFNSKENFVRAFKAEHHILPTEYKACKNSLKLYGRLVLESTDFQVEGKLAIIEPFQLVVYPSDESFVPNFWNKYNVNQWSRKLSGGAAVEDYGVSYWNPETHKLDYYIGVRKEAAKGDLTNAVTLKIEGGLYAVFQTPPASHYDFVNTIHKTWDYIAKVWLPENGYMRTGGYELESYVEESREFSETIYIPITKERV